MTVLENSFASLLSQNWWLFLIRGGLAIAFGVLAWARPDITVAALILMFGVYAIADGILEIWISISKRKSLEHWVLLLIGGLLTLAIGVMTFVVPGITGLVLLLYIAIWAIVTGVLRVVMGIRIRKEVKGEWILILGGVAGILFGGILMAQPAAGALAMIWVIGSYSIFFGILFVILAFQLRGVKKDLEAA